MADRKRDSGSGYIPMSGDRKFLEDEIRLHQRFRTLEARWKPVFQVLAAADQAGGVHLGVAAGDRPAAGRDAAHEVERTLARFASGVRDGALEALDRAYGRSMIRNGQYRIGLDNPAGWSVAHAEHTAFLAMAGEWPIRTARSAAAMLSGMQAAEQALADADACAWKTVSERAVGDDVLLDEAELTKDPVFGDFLAGIVRHAGRAADSAPEPERQAMRAAAAAIAYVTAESWEWEGLADLVSDWRPPQETPEERAVPSPGM